MTAPRKAVGLVAAVSLAAAATLLPACAGPGAARRGDPSGTAATSPGESGKAGPHGDSGPTQGTQPRSAGLTAAAIKAVVLGHAKALQACYEHELQDRLKLQGDLVVRVVVNPDGSASHPRIDATSKIRASDPLCRCVLDLVAGWRFPRPAADDSVELVLPFYFRPKAPPSSPQVPPAGGAAR